MKTLFFSSASEKDVKALNKDYDPFTKDEIYLDEMSPLLRLKYLGRLHKLPPMRSQRYFVDTGLPSLT